VKLCAEQAGILAVIVAIVWVIDLPSLTVNVTIYVPATSGVKVGFTADVEDKVEELEVGLVSAHRNVS
jgi:ABC-type transporter Mla subunit MlaD